MSKSYAPQSQDSQYTDSDISESDQTDDGSDSNLSRTRLGAENDKVKGHLPAIDLDETYDPRLYDSEFNSESDSEVRCSTTTSTSCSVTGGTGRGRLRVSKSLTITFHNFKVTKFNTSFIGLFSTSK